MQYKQLGKTELMVSDICLGTMTWGQQNTVDDAAAQLDYALSRGINFIDTAELYPVPPMAETQGRTESYIGEWLRVRGRRDDIVLASKVAGRVRGGDRGTMRGGPRLSRDHIREAVEGSLRRLDTDYLDLYQVHWPERNTNYFGALGYQPKADDGSIPIDDTLAALAELVDEGLIRHLGVSNETPWGLMRYLTLARERGLPVIASIQNPYNLLNRVFEIGLAEMAMEEFVSMLAYSPLAFGMLSGKYCGDNKPEGARLTLWSRFGRYTGEAAVRATDAYVALAREHGLDPAQMAIAYVRSRAFVTSTIIGATSMTQLTADIDAAQVELSPEVLSGIEAIHTGHPNPAP